LIINSAYLLVIPPQSSLTCKKETEIRLGGPRKELCWLIKRLQRPNPFQNGKLAWHLINTEKINRNRARKRTKKASKMKTQVTTLLKICPGE